MGRICEPRVTEFRLVQCSEKGSPGLKIHSTGTYLGGCVECGNGWGNHLRGNETESDGWMGGRSLVVMEEHSGQRE